MNDLWLLVAFVAGLITWKLIHQIVKSYLKPGVKVSIRCKHGRFIPGVHRFGKKISLYSCDKCDLWVEIRDFQGKVDW